MVLDISGSLATNIVTDVHEQRSVVARSRSKAVGAQPPSGGGNSMLALVLTGNLLPLHD